MEQDLFLTLWARAVWEYVGFADLIASVVGAAIAVLAWVGLIPWGLATAALVPLSLGVLAITLVAAFVVPWLMWRSARDEVTKLKAKPEVDVEFRSLSSHGDSLFRAMVHNRSSTQGHFHARIVATEGLPEPEPPWWVPWRHGNQREHLLLPDDREYLKVAVMTSGGSDFICLVQDLPGQKEKQHVASMAPKASLDLNVWHQETGRLVARERLEIERPSTTGIEPTWKQTTLPITA